MSSEDGVRSLGYLGLGVRDVPGWEQFAAEIVGLQPTVRSDAATLVRMDERSFRIALHPHQSDDVLYVGWEVADAAALTAIVKRLEAEGIAYKKASADLLRARRVGELVSCLDPDRIRCEFFWGAEESGTFASPRDLSGFVTGEQGMGHIVLAVRDAAATMRFYADVLGFRISDYIEVERSTGLPVKITFLHCNVRHHSLAFLEVQAPRRLSHLMIEARSLDDVGKTYSLCERAGVPIALTLGRHTNDQMFSFYVATPSGFNLEFGWGALVVDDDAWQIKKYSATSTWGHTRQAVPPLFRKECTTCKRSGSTFSVRKFDIAVENFKLVRSRWEVRIRKNSS